MGDVQANVEVVRRIYEEWGHGNMKAGVDLFAPNIVFETYMPDATNEKIVVHGAEEVEAFMREWLAQWRDFRLFGDDFRDVGAHKVLVAGHQTATGRESGIAVADSVCSVWTFRKDRVVSLRFERDKQKALEAAGLSE